MKKTVKKTVKVEAPKLRIKSAVKAGAAKAKAPKSGWLIGG